MNEKKSIHEATFNLFIVNPMAPYTAYDLADMLNKTKKYNTTANIITAILTRLYRKRLIQRTPVQLTNGYYYTLKNGQYLQQLYEDYLIPACFENKSELLAKVRKQKFECLKSNIIIDINCIKSLDFIKKYSLPHFKDKEIQQFLAILIGFSLCDRNIYNSNRAAFFFRLKADGELFIKDFQQIFPLEKCLLRVPNNGASYVVQPANPASFTKLLLSLGAVSGNKVFQPFLIPDWIFHGSDKIKKSFLSTVIGNEGSAPSHGRWRIQFVLSKSKENVPNLLDFLNQIRAMLYHFGITTSHIQLRKQPKRQYYGRFYIKGGENLHKFYKQFSFLYASEKQEILKQIMSKKVSREVKNVMT